MKSAILLMMALLILSGLANAQVTEAQRDHAVYANDYNDRMPGKEIKRRLIELNSCEDGYNLTRNKIDNNLPTGTQMLFTSWGIHAIGYFALGTSLGVLAYPAAALYTIGGEISKGTYTKSEKLFAASRFCNDGVPCNLEPLSKVRKWLKNKHNVDASNEEIAKLIDKNSGNLDFCTHRVKDNGVHVMKTYKQLRKEILENLSV